jgi:hypothetical protein
VRSKYPVIYLAAFALCASALGACGPSGPAGPAATATPVASKPASCARSQEGVPAIAATTAPAGELAPTYNELRARLDKLRGVDIGDQQAYEAARSEFEQYWSQLAGKRIEGWQGWVARTGEDVALSVRPWSEQAQASVSGPSAALVVMDDPYAAPPPGTPVGDVFPHNLSRAAPPYIYVSRARADAGQAPCVGQKVAFSGAIKEAPNAFESPAIVIEEAQMAVVEDKLPRRAPAADLRGLVIGLERTVCFGACPDYRVTVYDDGTVVYEGRNFTKVVGFRIASVEEDTLRKLVAEFEGADFFALQDYTNMDITDSPSAVTSISLPGKSHTVNHYFGDRSAPDKLVNLENKIDELLNTGPWVK